MSFELTGKILEIFATQTITEKFKKREFIVEYKDNHEIIGGLLGGTYWGWLYISILWVDEKYRHQGIGKKLIAEAKQEAEKRGCKYAHVDTMSFQAPKFYKKTSL